MEDSTLLTPQQTTTEYAGFIVYWKIFALSAINEEKQHSGDI